MKFFATFLLLVIAASCISAQHVTSWGNVNTGRILAEEKVVVAGSILQVQERTVTYRSVSIGWSFDVAHVVLNAQCSC